MTNERRWRIMKVTTKNIEKTILGWDGDLNHITESIGIPDDIQILKTYQEPQDFMMGFICFIVSSKTFDPVPEGGRPTEWIPEHREINVVITRKK